MAKVVLAGRDWQARALLRAQLIEEGLEVEAFETSREALAALERSPLHPSLLLADLYSSEEPCADVELLAIWAARVPIWIISSQIILKELQLKSWGFESILVRPIDVGKLVEQIRLRVGGSPPEAQPGKRFESAQTLKNAK